MFDYISHFIWNAFFEGAIETATTKQLKWHQKIVAFVFIALVLIVISLLAFAF
jgi:hypothetical protein